MASTAMAVMLGSAAEDPKLAQEMLPLLFVPQLLFAGFFVRPDLIPTWLRWAQYLCSLTYALRIVMIDEFGDGCRGGVEGDENCARLLSSVDAEEDDIWWYWLVLIAIFVGFRFAALAILSKKATKFL